MIVMNKSNELIVLAIVFLVASYFLGWGILIIGALIIGAEYYNQHRKTKKEKV